jgi:hypothetical protein
MWLRKSATVIICLPDAPLHVRQKLLTWATIFLWVYGTVWAWAFPVHIWVGITSVTIPFVFVIMILTLLACVFFLEIEAMQDMKRPFTSILRFTFGVINYIIRWLFRL